MDTEGITVGIKVGSLVFRVITEGTAVRRKDGLNVRTIGAKEGSTLGAMVEGI